MELTLHQQLIRLRKEKGNTQEELANHLGVTVQAVSKWERNERFPDITFLPAIAAFYNVSVDDLLGVGEAEKQKKLEEYWKKAWKLMQEGKNEERVALWREASKELPNNLSVVSGLMSALFMTDKKKYADEIIACAEQLLRESTMEEHRAYATHDLCHVYVAIGDKEKAKEYANTAWSYAETKDQLLTYILDGEEGIRYCQENIRYLMLIIWRNVHQLSQKGLTPEEQIANWNFALRCFETLYPDGKMGFYHGTVSVTYRAMAEVYCGLGQADEMFSCLDQAADHAIKCVTRKDEETYALPVLNRLTDYKNKVGKTKPGNEVIWYLKVLQRDCYTPYRDDPRMQALIERLQSVAVQ